MAKAKARRVDDVFTEGSADRRFVAWADLLGPETDLQTGARAIAVRAGFIKALLGDERVVEILVRWIVELAESPKSFGRRDLSRELLPLLARLEIPWPWCAMTLLDVFNRMVVLKVSDPLLALPVEEPAILAPAMVVRFETLEGEAVDDARRRLADLFTCAARELDDVASAAKAAHRRSPKGDAAYLEEWGRWYYAARVAEPKRSISSIAKARGGPDHRKHVRAGIAAAARLLALGIGTLQTRDNSNRQRRR
ncbi:MAG: hypothetical protein FJ027_04410 [Candidatus Rokubacteria bacterium]|nr:hypothetical protein [Candidatus Rokubacteria bacterium]